MPLSPPGNRAPLNTRRIACEGFRRHDGLWEVEATLLDTRTYTSTTPFRAPVQPGDAFHSMAVRIAIDDDRVLREVEACIDSHPFPECPSAAPNFASLVGLRLGGGFMRELQARVGGTRGCTHVITLINVAAGVAMQTLSSQIRWDDRLSAVRVYGPSADGDTVPPVVNACRGYSRDGEMVRHVYPELYQPGSVEATETKNTAGLP